MSRTIQLVGFAFGFITLAISGLMAISVRWPINAPAWMANPQALWGWIVGVVTVYTGLRIARYADSRLEVDKE